jgi:hypothetical protein
VSEERPFILSFYLSVGVSLSLSLGSE